VEDHKTRVLALMASDEWAEAHRVSEETLKISPDDPWWLNIAAKIAERLGNYDDAITHSEHVLKVTSDPVKISVANNRLGRLRKPQPAPAPPRGRRGHASERRDGTAFTFFEAFPHVDRSIDRQYDPDKHPWVSWTEIQTGMLADREARDDIEQWATFKGSTPEVIASKIQGLWAKAFTVPSSPDPTERYEQRADGNAYRPRQRE
jgi:tetratricopeptide (TPR) repeat protein